MIVLAKLEIFLRARSTTLMSYERVHVLEDGAWGLACCAMPNISNCSQDLEAEAMHAD